MLLMTIMISCLTFHRESELYRYNLFITTIGHIFFTFYYNLTLQKNLLPFSHCKPLQSFFKIILCRAPKSPHPPLFPSFTHTHTLFYLLALQEAPHVQHVNIFSAILFHTNDESMLKRKRRRYHTYC